MGALFALVPFSTLPFCSRLIFHVSWMQNSFSRPYYFIWLVRERLLHRQILQPLPLLRVYCMWTKLLSQYLFTLSSHKRGRCSNISSGSVSAAMTINSAMPRLRHLVAATNMWQFDYCKVSKVTTPYLQIWQSFNIATLEGLQLWEGTVAKMCTNCGPRYK